MNIRTSAFRSLATLSLIALGLAACDKKDVIVQPPQNPTTVTVSPASLTLEVGTTGTLVAVVANNTNTAVTWSSSNTAVATVSATGVVTAVAPGSATIIAQSAADANAKDAAVVTVTPRNISITLAPATATVAPGGTVQLVANVSGTTNTAVTYRSSATAVATVSAAGVVTAVAPGTAIITALAAADTTKKAVSTITVQANPLPVVTITPTVASVGVGGTQQFVATVSGATNTAVTWRSSSPAIATINAQGLATGVAQGTTVITAISVQDTMARATATLTVVGASVAIASVPTSPWAGPFNIVANVSVPAGTADSLMIRLVNQADTTKQYTIRCETFTAAGAATVVTCPWNPADLDNNPANGAQILPNATYQIQAILLRNNLVAATAIFGQPLTTNNVNTVSGSVSFTNTLDDVDNDPANPSAVSGGATWFGGDLTVTLAPSIFQGNTAATVVVFVDVDCDGVDDGAGEPNRTVTIASGTGSVTFPENINLTPSSGSGGVDNLEDASVCVGVYDARDAGGASVVVGAVSGNLYMTGATNPIVGPGQNDFRVDNVQPTFTTPVTLDAADFDGLTTDAYFGIGGSIIVSGSSSNVINGSPTDLGVGGVTLKFYAVPAASFDGTSQTTLQASAAAGTQFTTVDQLQSTLENDAYVLVIEAKDALGNVAYVGNAANLSFGVDLSRPEFEIDVIDASQINPDTMYVTFAVEDDFSGAESVRGTLIGHSVFEYDTDSSVEMYCYPLAGGAGVLVTSSVPCNPSTNSVPSATVGVTEYYTIAIPTDENFYVLTVQARDAAGNLTTVVDTLTWLVDPAPGATVDQVVINDYAVNNVANTVTVNGTVRDNIEVDYYDARWYFGAAFPASDATAVYALFPFTAPQNAGDYGLPLTASQAVSLTQTRVAALYPTPGGVGTAAAGVYLTVTDLAGNWVADQIAAGFGTSDGFTNFTSFLLTPATATIERDGGTDPQTVTLRATATTPVGATNPLQAVYFYYWTGLSWELISSVSAAQATVVTGETAREFRFSTTLNANSLPVDLALTQIVAIGVASDGDAVMSDVTDLTVND